ncbi:hypothetical protein BFW01_g10330 [Lasiodiplodia theobromae]|uniref:Uncharacterized protein n=2 Tax=Lasiodiplodia theobromae TaxID=45133 RepID=A0A5N5D4M6_9PEZI|nr:hypothetical protein DBV05_g8681 [Lasiodiplodia theobromae]KAF9629127.1 hypothetical protein BFW01_g10330 [Lasiodiplodia theobromae]
MPEWTEMRDELVNDCIRGALAVIDLCQTLDNEMGLARSSYTEFTSCCAALLAVLARRISVRNTRLQTACDAGIKLLKKMSVGVFSDSSEKLTVEALETAIHRLDSCSVASPAASGVAYAQFRQWAMNRQHTQCNEPATPRQTTTNTPQNADAMQGLYSFGLDDLSSLPGLDQWFEFGLH